MFGVCNGRAGVHKRRDAEALQRKQVVMLAEYKERTDVIATPDGLFYRVIVAGTRAHVATLACVAHLALHTLPCTPCPVHLALYTLVVVVVVLVVVAV